MFRSYGEDLQIIAVGDIEKEHAFQEAVQGVHGIIHTASPVTLAADDPQESARQYGPLIQRIVLTSSCVAILDTSDKEVTVSEKNWNNERVKECETLGRNASPLSKYAASKTLAEQAAWDFVKSHCKLHWDLVVINPPWIFGPPIHELTGPKSLNPSCNLFFNALVNNDFMGMEPTERPGHGWVDVRDVAAAHIRALEV
ncbi:hypothetical protein NQ176_g4494 [Zarea fungicola]|uniref:Uncharacterized protein n=1 Tax=Zarea fungicola TaxID=93591 RepID=A0ACC1ND31_9HYPO|nr:hypothetical protein NQ176_g4494 [Lecanicillium fungicola]